MEHADSDLTDPDAAIGAPPARGIRRGKDLQARVGILRNPNAPPVPPPRRAALTGRWPSLRSQRRPSGKRGKAAGKGASDPPDPQAADRTASVAIPDRTAPRPARASGTRPEDAPSIDIESLMASVAGIGKPERVRAPYSALALGDEGDDERPAPDRKPAILTAAAWLDEDEEEDDDPLGRAFGAALTDGTPWPQGDTPAPPEPAPLAPRRGPLWLGLAVLVLAAAAGSPVVLGLFARFGG